MEELLVEEVDAEEKEEDEVDEALDLNEEEARRGLLRKEASWVKEGIEGRSRWCLDVREAVLNLPDSSRDLPPPLAPPPPRLRTRDTDCVLGRIPVS